MEKSKLKNNKYEDQIDEILECYFANLTADFHESDLNLYPDDNDQDLIEAIKYGLSTLDEALTEEEFNQLRPGDFILVKHFQNNYNQDTVEHLIRPFLITHIIDDRAYGFVTTTVEPEPRYLLQYLQVLDYNACGLSKKCYLELECCNFYKKQFIKNKTDNKICLGHITDELKNKLIIRMQQIASAKTWLDNLSYYPNKIVRDIANM